MSDFNGDRRVKTHRPRFFEYLVVSCVVAAATVALHPLQRFIAEADIIMAYLAIVVVLAYYFNQKPTVLAALLSIAAFDFFFVSPFHTFAVDHVRVHMAQLRHKVELNPAQPKYLLTENGVGYRFRFEHVD